MNSQLSRQVKSNALSRVRRTNTTARHFLQTVDGSAFCHLFPVLYPLFPYDAPELVGTMRDSRNQSPPMNTRRFETDWDGIGSRTRRSLNYAPGDAPSPAELAPTMELFPCLFPVFFFVEKGSRVQARNGGAGQTQPTIKIAHSVIISLAASNVVHG
jgi:hypothetical protein